MITSMSSSTASSSSSSSSSLLLLLREERLHKNFQLLLKEEGFDPEDVNEDPDDERGCAWGRLSKTRSAWIVAHALGRILGHLEVLQWLSQDGGAHEDLRTLDNVGDAPLRLALRHGHLDVGRWLLRQRALSPRDTGVLDDATMRNDLSPYYDSYPKWNEDHRVSVLAWALDAITTHDNVKLFLTGTLVSASSCRRYPKNEYATRSHKRMKVVLSPLVLFQGKSGILELVAAYVEPKPKPHEFHLFRQLIEHLPAFIARTSPSSSYLHKKENSIRNTDNARGEE